MTKRLMRLCVAAVAAMGSSCGGGGGGDDAAASNPDAPSYLVLPAVSASGRTSDAVTIRTFYLGAYTLGLGELAVNVAQRMTHPGTPTTVLAPCSTGGSTFRLDDRDGNGRISVGDVLTAEFRNCYGTPVGAPLTGTMRIEVQVGTSAALDRTVALRVSYTDLRLESQSFNYIVPATVSGSLSLQWDDDDTTQGLRVITNGADELQFLSGFGPYNVRPDRLRNLEVSRRANFVAAEVSTSMAFVNEVNSGEGVVVMSTPQPVKSSMSGGSRSGEFRIQGREGHIRFGPTSTQGLFFEVWNSSLGTLVRNSSFFHSFADSILSRHGHAMMLNWSMAPDSVLAWVEFDPRSADCTVLGTCGLNMPDLAFLQPPLPQPSLTSRQARFRVQIGKPLAAVQPELRFELQDCNQTVLPSALPTWNIPATAVRQGAYFVIRPQEPLRHGRSYRLAVSSADDPSAPATVRLADGSTRQLNLGNSCIATSSELLVGLSADWPYLVGADDSVTLRSVATPAHGQGMASYRWEQVSGSSVRLGTPDAATTTVAYADATSRLMGEVMLQLTVTDVLGNEQRTRIPIQAGDRIDRPGLTYSEVTQADGLRARYVGPGGVPEAWAWPVGNSRAMLIAPLLDSGDGSPLTVKRYENAQPLNTVGSRPQLGAAMNTFDCPGNMNAWFEILEFDRDAAGVPSRLSFDYEVTCDSTRLPTLPIHVRGSYRFNSSIGVRF